MNEHPIHLVTHDDLRRSRLTVFFRALLAIPHVIWLQLWSYVIVVVAIIGWVAALITGSLPAPLHRFMAAYLRYDIHVRSYTLLIANPFPGFVGREGSYPLDLIVAGPQRQNRWTVLFRLLLVIPAAMISAVYGYLVLVVAILGWFAALATGRMPMGMRDAGALGLRYVAQTAGYALLLTGSYPYSGPTAAAATKLVPPTGPTTPQAPTDAPSADPAATAFASSDPASFGSQPTPP
ncbi:MAG TPA: DUF4389 domain-containing protein [Solirubrobacteraceae bacterium]|nr:DUF4389 domain-containing protein [Solirubrobacteraceae bacterium]